MNSKNQPYASLDPSLILDAVESIGLTCSGSLLALNSYENRVYQIGIEDHPPVIAKFYRPDRWSNEAILEEHQFSNELAAHEIPVIAPSCFEGNTLFYFKNYRFSLFQRKGGRALELDNLEQLRWMGRFIGRLHAMGDCRPYQHRPQLDVQSYGWQPYEFLVKNQWIPNSIQKEYTQTVKRLLSQIEGAFQKVGSIRNLRIHGDCHPGNILWRDEGPHIVDLDDSVMGPAIQDIWMILSPNQYEFPEELEPILAGYTEFHDFNRRELILIEPLRTLRMIRYAAWLAARWDDPAFPTAFPWFNTDAYWYDHLRNLTEQYDRIQRMEEAFHERTSS